MHDKLTCREFVGFLGDYLEGRLAGGLLARFNQHLASCPSCVSYTRSYRDTVRLGQGAFSHPDDALPGDVPEELVRAILAARDGEP